jgi:uncharacterized protein (TIGR00730 family)
MSSKKAFDNPEFMHSREARPLRILSEYIEPEKRFEEYNIRHTVVFFGSARIKDDPKDQMYKYFKAAEEMAFKCAKLNEEIEKKTGENYYICTGGGPGIMEAANKGASKAGAATIGLNIDLPFEQSSNKYITPEYNFDFHYFFMRKMWFLYQAKAILIFPGGFGTLDELFETLTLIQTRKLEKLNIPILLYDKEFWEDLVNFQKFVDLGLISPEDLNLFQYFNDIDEGIEMIKPRLINIIENVHNYLEMKFPI